MDVPSGCFPYLDKLPQLAPDVFIAPNAAVIGDVVIGQHSSVWFSTTIRGDVMPIVIGARTSIQDNSVVHATGGWQQTEIGSDCVIGHGVILHGCVIADHVLVGMGSIVMDAAKVGAYSIIGAGSLVTAKTEIPEGVLAIGRPARVKRELTHKERDAIDAGVAVYVQKNREYRGAL